MERKFSSLFDIIYSHKSFLILIHEKADGDAIGSSTALGLFLKKLGKDCAIVSPSFIPKRLEFAKARSIRYMESAKELKASGFFYECVISTDVASPQLLADVPQALGLPIFYAIDHHRSNTLEATEKYVDDTASAAGEIIYSIIKEYESVTGESILDKEICNALYTSVSSDSGCFKYGNTTADTHKIGAALIENGANAEEINRLLFDVKTMSQIRTEALAYKNIKTYYDGKLIVITIDIAELDAIGATEEDTETISQLARMIEGVQIGVLMREKINTDGNSVYKFSVRSNCDSDISKLCGTFGGGGHKKAAGCTIAEEKEKALSMFVKEAEKYLC